MAAGVLLVREAGGLVQGLRPNSDPLASGSVICANEPIFDSFAKIIRQD
jgi:myo-inositol-1(or 4)-monophosphatase